jgi:hypothetical protein
MQRRRFVNTLAATSAAALGMDGPEYKGRKDRFDVLLVQRDGSTRVYQTHA